MKIIREQLSSVGLVSTASDVDSGTDDTKFLTAKSLANSTKIPTVAPGALGNVMKSDGSKWISEALAFTAEPFYEIEATEVAPTITNVLNGKVYSKTGTYSNGIVPTTKFWANAEADNPGDKMGRHTISPSYGDPYLNSTYYKFGLRSYSVTVGRLNLLSNLSDFDVVTNTQWSLDFWARITPAYGNMLFSVYAGIQCLDITSDHYNGRITVRIVDPDTTVHAFGTPNNSVDFNVWAHWAFQRNGNTWSVWKNGTLVVSTTITFSATAPKTITSAYFMSINTSNYDTLAYMDDVRFNLSCEFPLDNTNFTPNNEAYFNNGIYAEDVNFIDGLDNEYSLTKPDWNNIQNIPSSLGDNTLTSLDDTPSTYVGQAGKIATVNSGETGIEFSPVAKNNYAGTVAPSVSNDSSQGYSIGSTWIDTTSSPKEAYRCVDNSVGAAVWINTTFTADEVNPTDWSNVTNKPAISGTNTGDQVGDGVTITGAGTIGDPFVSIGGTGGGGTTAGAFEYFTTVGDDSTTVFALGFSPADAESTVVSLNGLIQKPTTDYTITGSDLTFIVAPSLSDVIEVRVLGEIKLTADTTVNFVSTETAAQIQAKIDAQPKNLGGYTLTFQFADGTYTVDSVGTFDSFYGGYLIIQGNLADTDDSNTYSVILDVSVIGVNISNCFATCLIQKIRINLVGTADFCMYVVNMPELSILSCTLYGRTTAGNGIRAIFSKLNVKWLRADICYIALDCYDNTLLFSNENSTITSNLTGLASFYGSTIVKNGIQPTGTSLDERTSYGGVIR